MESWHDEKRGQPSIEEAGGGAVPQLSKGGELNPELAALIPEHSRGAAEEVVVALEIIVVGIAPLLGAHPREDQVRNRALSEAERIYARLAQALPDRLPSMSAVEHARKILRARDLLREHGVARGRVRDAVRLLARHGFHWGERNLNKLKDKLWPEV